VRLSLVGRLLVCIWAKAFSDRLGHALMIGACWRALLHRAAASAEAEASPVVEQQIGTLANQSLKKNAAKGKSRFHANTVRTVTRPKYTKN
jgi:hypothetical protein